MPCYSQLKAYYSKDIGKSGKRGITFDRNSAFSGIPFYVPCGQCVGCRLEYSRQWAIRCMHEKMLHTDSTFVTLTYDDKNLPEGGTLVKRDLQLFMKRLRKKKGNGIRFYACGEYGERTFRPHYHVLLFNAWFSDQKFYKISKSGERLYWSKECEELWPYGFNVIGDVTFDSVAYCARYVVKKIRGKNASAYYERVDGNGVVYDLVPEFALMSRRPGIGAGWYERFGAHAYEFDSVIMNGLEIRPPRFYDGRFELENASSLARIKRKRRRNAARFKVDNLVDRRRVRERVAQARLKIFAREI